jgi:hypothetical protein
MLLPHFALDSPEKVISLLFRYKAFYQLPPGSIDNLYPMLLSRVELGHISDKSMSVIELYYASDSF